MTAPAEPTPHPLWCTRAGCATRGWHASRRLVVDLPGGTGPAVNLRLVQLVVGGAEPHITLTAADREGPALLLTVRQARIMRRFLGRLVEMGER